MKSSDSQAEQFLEASDRHWFWVPAAVLIVGVASVVMLFGSDRIRERWIHRDMSLIQAVERIQTEIATSHLWLEEYVTGDDINLNVVWDSLDRAASLAAVLVSGGDLEMVGRAVERLEDPVLLSVAEHLQRSLAKFDEISRQRHLGRERGEEVGIGSAMDVEYDRVFSQALLQARVLERALVERLVRNNRRSSLLFRAILAGWVLIIGLAVGGLWAREKRRQSTVAALRSSEAQLHQAQKMEAVGRLAGGIAHDINNYLAAITANCELLQMGAEPDGEVAQRTGAVVEISAKASNLIDRLLAFSRRQPAEPRVVDLNHVIEDLGDMVERLIGEDVRFEMELGENLWPVKIDPAQVEQIAVNLVVNAREAMPTGGRVLLETANTELDRSYTATHGVIEPGAYVMLSVTDDGPGMDPEVQERIFDPFFTTKESSGNSGLGLATVYGIVRQNRGYIWAYSEPGHGATLKIYLPRSDAAAAPAEVKTSAAPHRGAAGERILLVEDNDDFREATQALLEKMGYKVSVAGSGEQALDLYRRENGALDLVITDLIMPGMRGDELAERIRSESGGPPVIFISGYAGGAVLGASSSKESFLQKPFSAAVLDRKIRETLAAAAATLPETPRTAPSTTPAPSPAE